MGVLEYYAVFENTRVEIKPRSTYIFEEGKVPEAHLEFNSIPITLAEQSSLCAGKLTAHKVRDYRKRQFSLLLLPEVDIFFDRLLNKEVTDELL